MVYMSKRALSICIFVLLIFILPFLIAEENITISTTENEQSKVDKAYECLEKKIEDNGCSELSQEERIFSLLAVKECKSDVIENSKNDEECWSKSSGGECDIKTTAQAILALDKTGTKTDKAENWLFLQNATSIDLDWFLEIESSEPTTCTITYTGSSHSINIGEDKKINTNAGSCLSLSEGNYWFKVSPRCYETEFEISCTESFLTTLLFKKKTSETIHVLEKTNSASAEGKTKEKINSLCFKQGNSCNYEGSLWATLVMDNLGYDISSFIPYLITMAEEQANKKFIPESFLYILTGYDEIRNDLLLKQKSNKWWAESGDKFYDTAIALYPFQYEETLEKTGSIEWLNEVQDDDGCWQGNIRNTAFILNSVWPKDSSTFGIISDGEELIDCEESGYDCMSGINCQGKILNSYSCSGVFKCCDTPKSLETCSNQGGEICNSNQICVGGRNEESSDLDYDQTCCIRGSCQDKSTVSEEISECESSGGKCKVSCGDREEDKGYTCTYSTDACCISKPSEKGKNYLWIIILIILIALVILGIVYRDKLRPYWFRLKSKFNKSKGKGMPGFGPGGPRGPPRMDSRIPPKRIIHSKQPPTQRRPLTKPKNNSEIDDVLKKLKEMGK